MGGHLFVVNGDVTRLACDAWLLPTDNEFRVSASFAPSVGLPAHGRLSGRDWRSERVQPFGERPDSDPWIWLGDVGRGNAAPDWYAGCAFEFVEKAAGLLKADDRTPSRFPIVAVNVLGSGEGGLAADKGAIHHALIPVLEDAARRFDVDVVLVTWGRRAYAAAQRARRDHLEADMRGDRSQLWDLDDQEGRLAAVARRLAEHVQGSNLVLFLGAGVSSGAGLPVWQQLLDELAHEASFSGEEISRLHGFDLRDQAALVGKRLSAVGRQIGKEVAARFSTTRYSLMHALLASLGVRENVTTNYDQLFEAAVEATDERLAVLPYQAVHPRERWLLKLHGSIDNDDDIVLTRADYLGTPARRGALFGLVQAMLLTRHMLFVGYSLSDEDFHAVVNDVRAARAGVADAPPIGTVLTLFDDPMFEELWSADLEVAAVTSCCD